MKGKKVLVVDDEAFVREIIKVRLKLLGIEIVEGTNGVEAIEKAIKEKPDLILLDLMMPKMNGFEACEKLRSNPITSHIPIMILTARGEQMDKERGQRVGAVKYLTKPFSPQKLAEQVIEIIENAAI
ncbi:MAG: response regulator [Nitrospiria bacterium]